MEQKTSPTQPQRQVRRRPLGTFDHAQALTADHHPYNIVTAVRLEGVPDAARLQAVLDEIVSRHPMLHSRISSGRKRFLELAPVSSLPLEQRAVTDEGAWIGAIESELEFDFDLEKPPLGRCTLLTHESEEHDAGATSDLILTFPHALVDGIAVTQLVKELLRSLSSEALGSSSLESTSLPASCDGLFPGRWQRPRRLASSAAFLARQMGDEMSYRLATRGRHSRPPAGPFKNRVLPISLTADETAALVRESRQHRVSLVATLEAAMLLAVAKHCFPELALPHRYCAFPLLRQYLEPSVGDDVVACYVTVLRLTTRVAPGDQLWDLARRIHADLEKSMRRGERFLASVWSHFSMRTIFSQSSHRMSTTALSYTGALPLPESYGELRVREVHAFVSNFPLGPLYTAQSRMFRGRLWLDLLYLDSDLNEEEARGIAEETRSLLTGANAGAGLPITSEAAT